MSPNKNKGSGLAVTALVLGILAIVFSFLALLPVCGWFAIVVPLAGIVFGILGITSSSGRGMAIAGLILSSFGMVITVGIIIVVLVVVGSTNLAAPNLSAPLDTAAPTTAPNTAPTVTSVMSVAGAWNMTISPNSGNPCNGVLALTQNDSALSGTVTASCHPNPNANASGYNGQLTVIGTVSGNEVSFTGSEQVTASQVFEYTFTATVDASSNTMSGSVTTTDLSGINPNPSTIQWTATRSA